MGMFSHFFSFTSLCVYDFKAGFIPRLLVILFTTEGKEKPLGIKEVTSCELRGLNSLLAGLYASQT